MLTLSIVIPAVGSIESLESTLVSVLENRPPQCEIIVVLNRPYADPYELKEEVRFIEAERGTGLPDCANIGVRHAHARVAHVLASGVHATPNWTSAALRHFDNPQVAAVAPAIVDQAEQQVIAGGVRYWAGGSRRVQQCNIAAIAKLSNKSPFAPALSAGFYCKAALQRVGGFTTQLGDELADADLAVALSQAGLQVRFEPDARLIAMSAPEPCESSWRQGLYAERLFWRNAPAVGWWKSLAFHPWTVAARAARSMPSLATLAQLAGRFLACCDVGHYPPRHAQLRSLVAGSKRTTTGTTDPHLRVDASHAARQSSSPTERRAGQSESLPERRPERRIAS